MAKDSFTFKQFSVHQDRCAMKVGTDGTLLGAWALAPHEKCRILDIGTGTGLIALMMAQRYPNAEIIGIDIDADACTQAKENVNNSPFFNCINIVNNDISDYHSDPFDAIVCNPPYFVDSLECPKESRTIARHSSSLSYHDLLMCSFNLLSDIGRLSLIIPSDSVSSIESEASMQGFLLSRKCAIRTTPKKSPKRFLIEFLKYAPQSVEISEEVLEISPNVRSEWYKNLTKDFYLR